MPLGTRNWGGTEYHDSIFDPESQPQEYEQPYVQRCVPSMSQQVTQAPIQK